MEGKKISKETLVQVIIICSLVVIFGILLFANFNRSHKNMIELKGNYKIEQRQNNNNQKQERNNMFQDNKDFEKRDNKLNDKKEINNNTNNTNNNNNNQTSENKGV